MKPDSAPKAEGDAQNLSRRRLLQGMVGIGANSLLPHISSAASTRNAPPQLIELRGQQFNLEVGELPVAFTGRQRTATAINGRVPAPLLRWREGDEVTIRVHNRLPVTSSIHWHGILLPTEMDGVPGLSFPGIAPGETFTYRFRLNQSGTYWYHSHSRFQEQTGMYGPIVIEPRAGERHVVDRDYVVMLSDWSDTSPEAIFENLKKMGDIYNFNEPTARGFLADVRKHGIEAALASRRMWNQMRMSPTDLADVTGHAYTYLMNGATSLDNWTGLFKRGERVRLRFINGSAMSIFDVRIPGLKMTVVATDGQDVEPVSVDEFRIAVAETYDVIVEPGDDRAWCVFAQTIDRTGSVSGTLAPREGMRAEAPAIDAPQWLSMTDMMGAMTMQGMSHGGSSKGMGGSCGGNMGKTTEGSCGSNIGKGMEGSCGASMGMSMGVTSKPRPVRHASTEFGPGVDMRVDTPRDNIDDPGIGLRNNGRRVLTYADLHTIGGPLEARDGGREVELHLTGNMERYMWAFDGQPFADATPLHLRHHERVRITLVNDSMMPHPIHLHGLWSELLAPDGNFQVRKHTIMVQPAQRVSYLVSADALGRWAYHCHLLYHMEAGMFREVVVS